MHICFLSHEYPLWATGGIGSFVQTISRGLVKEGHIVTVIGWSNLPQCEFINDKGVLIYRLPTPKIFRKGQFIENAYNLRKKLKEINAKTPIDILETTENGLFLIPSKTPYKKVIRMHGGHHFFAESENRPINKWKALQEKRSFKRADAFVAPSQYAIKHTCKFLSTNGKPEKVISYSIDSNIFRQADFSKAKKHKLVFAGVVCEKKGVRQLIQAFSLVKEKYQDATLDVYGREWFFFDGSSYTQYLKNQFSEEIFKNITFHGAIELENIPLKYEEAELCVFPSHMETLGLVAPEAMMMGKPVLFTEAGPGPETVTHNKTGLLCNPHSPEDIASKIIYAFENPETMKEIAANGQKLAISKFEVSKNFKANIDFYESLL